MSLEKTPTWKEVGKFFFLFVTIFVNLFAYPKYLYLHIFYFLEIYIYIKNEKLKAPWVNEKAISILGIV
jgi:hypothetical protein